MANAAVRTVGTNPRSQHPSNHQIVSGAGTFGGYSSYSASDGGGQSTPRTRIAGSSSSSTLESREITTNSEAKPFKPKSSCTGYVADRSNLGFHCLMSLSLINIIYAGINYGLTIRKSADKLEDNLLNGTLADEYPNITSAEWEEVIDGRMTGANIFFGVAAALGLLLITCAWCVFQSCINTDRELKYYKEAYFKNAHGDKTTAATA